MRSLSFLLSVRWILFGITVGLAAWGMSWLGDWQFDRLQERKADNAVIERNIDATPLPAHEVLSLDEPLPAGSEWRRVRATGEYDESRSVVVRYRHHDGNAGVEVLVPLVDEAGNAFVVDRGWLAADNAGQRPEAIPASPTGQVEVIGWARADATGAGTGVTDGSTRAIDSQEIGEAVGLTTYRGFIVADEETPPPAQPLTQGELPDLGRGPHFFYGLQWWFFALFAILGFLYLAYDEWRKRTALTRE